jgi:hypothetical protein
MNKYGRLTVIGDSDKKYFVEALCECGSVKEFSIYKLKSGHTKSCGCFNIEENRRLKTKHGKSFTRTYGIWNGMKQRCDNPNYHSFDKYNEKSYCDSWSNFENFLKDMGECPEGLELDRIDNDLGYFKENCRYVSRAVQCHNKIPTSNTGVRGVYKLKNRFRAKLGNTFLGSFKTLEEAKLVYDEKAKEKYNL